MKKQIIKGVVLGASFFIGISYGYLFLFAALDWSNLTTNVGTGTTLTADLWNNSLTNLKNNSDINNASIGKLGSVVTVWGRKTAPSGSTLLYDGTGFGPHYTHNGGSRLCIKGGEPGGSNTNLGDLLYPLATGAATYMPPGVTADRQIFCAVVHVL